MTNKPLQTTTVTGKVLDSYRLIICYSWELRDQTFTKCLSRTPETDKFENLALCVNSGKFLFSSDINNLWFLMQKKKTPLSSVLEKAQSETITNTGKLQIDDG